MNPEIKPRWVEKLRSGKYEQGRKSMNRHGRFCCLGVLMEIAVEDGLATREASGDGTIGEIAYRDDSLSDSQYGAWSGLSMAMQGWAGLDWQECSVLAGKNDSDRLTFDQIADYIEDEL